MNLKILNTKETKEIRKKILEQWGCDFKTDFAFLLSSKNRLYLVSKDISKIEYEKLRLQVVGVYFGEIMDNGELRLSIEGSQLIGKEAKKNIVEIEKENVKKWLYGNDIKVTTECTGFVIVKNDNDFMGTGKIKEGEILNFIPKIRRITSVD
jgi:NOL1/NOP2/fmu family ribosome biogenesis protein